MHLLPIMAHPVGNADTGARRSYGLGDKKASIVRPKPHRPPSFEGAIEVRACLH